MFLVQKYWAHGPLGCKTLFTGSLLGRFGTYIRFVIIRLPLPLPSNKRSLFTCLPSKKNNLGQLSQEESLVRSDSPRKNALPRNFHDDNALGLWRLEKSHAFRVHRKCRVARWTNTHKYEYISTQKYVHAHTHMYIYA